MRLTVAALAWLALAATAVFVVQSEQQLQRKRIAGRAFDLHAREAATALSDLRAAQEAYVAAGQGAAYWMPKVAATRDTAAGLVAALAESAQHSGSKSAVDEASKALADFAAADKRARDYINSGEQLMAADVVFTDGAQTTATALQQVEAARLAEREAQDTGEASLRTTEAGAAAGAAAFAALSLLVVALRPQRVSVPAAERSAVEPAAPIEAGPADLALRPEEAAAPRAVARPEPAPLVPLQAAASVCTDFARAREANDLTALLGRAAEVLDAKGLIVWLGDSSAGALRPVLAHGYPPQALARMPAVPRAADNAAAMAYRTAELQIVPARAGRGAAALVAPLLAPEVCAGALSIELRSGGASENIQALAAIFAAQLAAIVGGSQQTAQGSDARAAASVRG